jgi:thiol-disulfide isomerase/thioredoxin
MIYTTKIDSNNFDEFVNSENVSLVYISASWCGPCRQENPNVVANYNRFKSKN